MQMAIITSYVSDDAYGLLGPQMAATIIQEATRHPCIVIAVTRDDDKDCLKKALSGYFGSRKPVIGFSALSGREDLFDLAKELKDEGAVTILAGPQADADFRGEEGWQQHPHRFKGLSDSFQFALHGPAEQAISLLSRLDGGDWPDVPGLSYKSRNGGFIQNPKKSWDESYLGKVRWDNLYVVGAKGITPLRITSGQVLQQIGCPHAARAKEAEIDYPEAICPGQGKRIKLPLRGCSFCDVAADKGVMGRLSMETVIGQIRCLPEARDGGKIPFELINEYPLSGLPDLLKAANRSGLRLSQINLTLRADGLIAGAARLEEALRAARQMGVCILLSAIGFESFDDSILRNLNKGISVQENLEAVRLIRRFKAEFPNHLGYSTQEGAIHGFIHPTPWDSREIVARAQKTMYLYGLPNDILPLHSIPLIIHHASGLGAWIREIEQREWIRYKRSGPIICWWEEPAE
jgi:hypothetical protein